MLKLLKKLKVPEVVMLVISVVLILGQIYFELSLPDFMSDITVLLNSDSTAMKDILIVGLKMLGCTAGSAALAIITGYLLSRMSSGLSCNIRGELFNKVIDLGREEMLEFSVPSLINRTTNDITQIQMLMAMGVQMMIKAPVMAVWAVIKILNKSAILSGITGGYVIVLLIVMAVAVIVVFPRVRRVQKLTDDINLVARENLNGISVVHAFNAEKYQNEKFEKANTNLWSTQLFNQRVFAALMPMVNLEMSTLMVVIYWVGAVLINNLDVTDAMGKVTMLSNVVVFSTYASYVLMSLMMLVMIVMFVPGAQVSANRINEVLERRISVKQGTVTEAPEQGTVEFKNVSFRYSSGGNVLENINFKVNKGETVAFIGATGSGKTSLVSLMARFYDATEGDVFVDGVNVKEYTFDALYNRIAYVTQKAVLFAGDIKDNVLFGESTAAKNDESVNDAIRLACASEFVDKLEDGINAPIAQGGSNVSGGQKQRISIARALARKPEILIFDDSFSALDYKTDAQLRAGLADELNGVTKVIVAQRIGTIKNADRIVVLDDGKAVGIGTHSELMDSCSVYREIALSQLSEAELAQ